MNSRFALLIFFMILSVTPLAAQNYAHYCDIKPAMRNRELEHAGVCAANKKAGQMGCREVFKMARIVSSDWEYFYEGDMIVGRKIHMEVYGETWEGQCGITHFIFKQKYSGHEYGNLRCDFMGDFYDMDCESGHDVVEKNYYGE